MARFPDLLEFVVSLLDYDECITEAILGRDVRKDAAWYEVRMSFTPQVMEKILKTLRRSKGIDIEYQDILRHDRTRQTFITNMVNLLLKKQEPLGMKYHNMQLMGAELVFDVSVAVPSGIQQNVVLTALDKPNIGITAKVSQSQIK